MALLSNFYLRAYYHSMFSCLSDPLHIILKNKHNNFLLLDLDNSISLYKIIRHLFTFPSTEFAIEQPDKILIYSNTQIFDFVYTFNNRSITLNVTIFTCFQFPFGTQNF